MNKKITTILAAGFLTLGMAAQACTLGAWDDNTSTSLAGGPDPSEPNVFARYSGLCAMQTAGATPSVLNNGQNGATSGPGGEESMITRFYFKADGNTGTLFETYENDTPAPGEVVYNVSLVGTNIVVTGGAAVLTVPVNASINWHSVEVSWANDGGSVELWVDSDATAVTSDASTTFASTASISSAVLGGAIGITFDAYESRRSTPIGRLLPGDANGDASINVSDATAVVNEAFGSAFNTGQPDCNEDGAVNVSDATCVVTLAFGS
jgi:hypothetical protein